VFPFIAGLISAIRIEKASAVGMTFLDDYPINKAKINAAIILVDVKKRPHRIFLSSEWQLNGSIMSFRNNAGRNDEWFYQDELELNLGEEDRFEKLTGIFENFVRESAKKYGKIANTLGE
jgi:hypothetical protein